MKVCEKCGDPISTPDGDNMCTPCDERRTKRNTKARARRRGMKAAMESIGVVQVRGEMGGVYWG